jgi:hypothetical protein
MAAQKSINYSCRAGGQPFEASGGSTVFGPAPAMGTDFAVASVRQVVFNAQLFNQSADGLIVLLRGLRGDPGERRGGRRAPTRGPRQSGSNNPGTKDPSNHDARHF